MRVSMSFGLAFEGYGPVGEARTKDLAGRPVDASAVFPGGSEGAGFEGVRTYIREHRQKDFVDNLSRKLLAYALEPVAAAFRRTHSIERHGSRSWPRNDYRFDSLVETIVTSPQFLQQTNRGLARKPAVSQATRKVIKMPRSTDEHPLPRVFPAARFFAARECTMALPWLESLHAFADTAAPPGLPQALRA